jgi:hypothetical protein
VAASLTLVQTKQIKIYIHNYIHIIIAFRCVRPVLQVRTGTNKDDAICAGPTKTQNTRKLHFWTPFPLTAQLCQNLTNALQ